MRKLWVDDIRKPPDETWTWVRTSHEAIVCLCMRDDWNIMSLDHDLGDGDDTRQIIHMLCQQEASWPFEVFVHSANPVGAKWLEGMIDRYKP